MKKRIALLLSIVMLLSLCGCAEYEQLSKSIQEAARAVESVPGGYSAAPAEDSNTQTPLPEETAHIEEQPPKESPKPAETVKPQETAKLEETVKPEKTAKPSEPAASAEQTAAQSTPEPAKTPVQIAKTPTERILESFTELSRIPRASHNEAAIGDYLCSWGTKNGLSAEKDSVGNVIIELPASTGCENAPLTVLQAHMDIMAVTEDGKSAVSLSNGITPKRNGNLLSAQGSSLGADNGIGIAAALCLISDESLVHGPVRVIFTVNGEDGMSGAKDLDARFLTDASYLINLDNDNVDECVTGSAYGSAYSLNFTPAWKAPEGDTAYEISVSGLLGGNSGSCADMGRANAVKILSGILARSFNEGLMPEIAAISGGSSNDSIPDAAAVTVVIRDADAETFEKIISEQSVTAKERYGNIEKTMLFNCSRLNTVPDKVLYGPIGRSLTEILFLCPDGVNTMETSEPGTVESSSNLGLMKQGENELCAFVYTRSSSKAIMDEQEAKLKLLCAMTECGLRQISETPGWAREEDNPLASMAAEIYQVETGKEMQTGPVYNDLECGWMTEKNPQLHCVSIGATIHEAHTAQESVDIDSIAVFARVLRTMMERIAAE